MLYMILKSRALEFVKSFILCEINEVNLILEDIFFEANTMDMKTKVNAPNDKAMMARGDFKVNKDSYGKRKQVKLGLDEPNER